MARALIAFFTLFALLSAWASPSVNLKGSVVSCEKKGASFTQAKQPVLGEEPDSVPSQEDTNYAAGEDLSKDKDDDGSFAKESDWLVGRRPLIAFGLVHHGYVVEQDFTINTIYPTVLERPPRV